MDKRHVLLITFPAQGHLNPALQFAKRLINMGIHVTFATCVYALRRMPAAASAAKGLTFVSFSDGYDDGFQLNSGDPKKYIVEIRSNGSKCLKETIAGAAANGRPITSLVYTLLLPWASQVARESLIPSALLWIQPATVLNVYYYYFNGFADEISACSDEPSWRIQIPGAPSLSKRDLPSFLLPSEANNFALPTFKEQLEVLDMEPNPKVLVNTFDALEVNALHAIEKYELIGVGPLIPSAFLDGRDPMDRSSGGDLFKNSDEGYIEWLDSKSESSVVYVSFGSLLRLTRPQREEIAKGLLATKRPFLWVIRAKENSANNEEKEEKEEEEMLSCFDELVKVGKIVEWCSQLEVLTHPSLGCFVTHCGWNSTLESLSCGVPVVAFPHWTDQGTNAKLIEDEWRVGIRVRANGEGVVESGEIRRCVEEVMESRELRENALKWKGLARQAVGENGSSYNNLKDFFLTC